MPNRSALTNSEGATSVGLTDLGCWRRGENRGVGDFSGRSLAVGSLMGIIKTGHAMVATVSKGSGTRTDIQPSEDLTRLPSVKDIAPDFYNSGMEPLI